MGINLKKKVGEILLDTKVIGSTKDNDKIVIQTTNGDLHTKKVINCAGLHSDRIAKLFGLETELKIIPFRGEYYTLKKKKNIWLRD